MNKGWGVFTYVSASLLIAVFGFLLLLPIIPTLKNDFAPNVPWILVPFSLIMIGIFVIAILDTAKGKFVIDKNRIYSVTTLSYSELLFNEIKGYRRNSKFILIEAKNPNKKNIKISTYFGKTNEIIEWLLNHNYHDLDVVQENDEKNAILNNEEFGWNKAEREKKLNTACQFARITNVIGVLSASWVFFYPNPYQYSIIPAIVFPIICLFILRHFKGLIKIGKREKSTHPTIFIGFFGSIIALTLRALRDFSILEYSNVWIPIILIASIYITVLLFCIQDVKYKKLSDFFNAFGVLIIVMAYSYSSFITVNCLYDKSEPEIFNAVILDKVTSSGKNTTYYLDLSPWGPRKQAERITVSREQYDNFDINDEASIYLMKGKFDVQWFKILRK